MRRALFFSLRRKLVFRSKRKNKTRCERSERQAFIFSQPQLKITAASPPGGDGVTCFLLEFHSHRYLHHPESFYFIAFTRPGIINAGIRIGVVPGVIILFCANIYPGVKE